MFGTSVYELMRIVVHTYDTITVPSLQTASIASMATPFGCIFTGWLMDMIGRRKSILVTQVPSMLGWILIACATNLPMIYIGRMLTGLGSGMIGAPARVYVSEVTQPHLRGMLGALSAIFVSSGVLFQYVVGSITSWRVLGGLCALCPLSAFLLMLFMPESPNYLVIKERSDKARKSLAKLRGSTFNVDGEVHRLQTFTEQQKANSVEAESSFRDTLNALLSPSAIKPFVILSLYFMMYQFSGVNTITFYAVEIFQQTGTTMDKNMCTILLGVTRLLFTVAAVIAMRKVGRRPLTFVSGRLYICCDYIRTVELMADTIIIDRHRMRFLDDWPGDLHVVQIPVGSCRSADCTGRRLDSGAVHFRVHDDVHRWLSGGAVGDDWRTVSAEGARIAGRDDHMHGAQFRVHCGENVSVYGVVSAAAWHFYSLRMHLVCW